MKDRRRRNIMIGSLCALLVFMGIGYALISQMLTIRGVSTVAGDWNIYIDSITPNAVGTGVSVNESVGLDKVSASFEANLYVPGDKVEYKIVVKNDGNIDAKLGVVNQHVTNDTEGIVKYSNTLENGYILRHGESYVFYVTTEIEEEKEEIPSEDTVRAVLELKLNFIQYTGRGSNPSSADIEVASGNIDTIGSEIVIGTEHFYVIESDDNEVKLLSKYNLLVGSDYIDGDLVKTYTSEDAGYNKQSESAVGEVCEKVNGKMQCTSFATVSFETPKPYDSNFCFFWDDDNMNYYSKYIKIDGSIFAYDNTNPECLICTYVEGYREILENDFGLEVLDATLMNEEQLDFLRGCPENGDDSQCTYPFDWIDSTSYWTGIVLGNTHLATFGPTNSFGNSGCAISDSYGVRPIIVISKDLFN